KTSLVNCILDRATKRADLVLTLSQAVAEQLVAKGHAPASKVISLFHPDLNYSVVSKPYIPAGNQPFRLLMMGRILPYKGLPLFLDAVNTLRAKGLNFQIGVFGDGELGESAGRLSVLGAEVVNRWLDASEIATALARYDVMVVCHTEASQSGVVAMALGAGLPVVATPVGGLVEQITDGHTGVLARRVDATALA